MTDDAAVGQLLKLAEDADLEVALGVLHRQVGLFLATHEATVHATYWKSMPGHRVWSPANGQPCTAQSASPHHAD